MNNEILSKKTPNILIVDDIPDNLRVLGDMLKGEGYKVRPVLNGTLALQVAEKEKPDLILLDIMMPDIDGYEVSKRLQENQQLKDIPVIFISALNEINDIVKAFSAGGVDYITKPFKAEEVKARVATHLKMRQQKLRLQELISEKVKFFSIIAHDLRGPLGGLMMLAEMMKDNSIDLSSDQKKDLTINLSDSARNIYNLLENLLQWSRMQQGQIEFRPLLISLKKSINECVTLLTESARNKSIKIEVDVNEDFDVIADTVMLQIIIRNLISNAIKFTHQGGKISIIASKDDNSSILVTVKDNGIGMEDEILNNLFRIDTKTSRPGTEGEPSTGLGLLLCKEFVEKQGGKIWAKSELNKGSEFCFTISIPPTYEDISQLEDENTKNELDLSLKNLKVLIVEDDKISMMLINLTVKKFAKEVLNAKTGLEAVEICRNHADLDLIITDIKMPEMDGYEATRQIRQFNKDVIIIAQTAFSLSDEKEKAIEAGCNDYIPKPINIALLKSLILKHIKTQVK
ncbi:MAG: response regulator [Bacteroidales bacterium]